MSTSASPEAAELNTEGLNVLYDGGTEAKVDIVFVHGLRGHPQHTWEAVNPDEDADEDNKKIFWPKVLLPNTIKDCRIFSYGYPTDFVTFYPIVPPVTSGKSISRMSIDNHSTALMLKLGNIRRDDSTTTRPIIFVAHSLGGLVTANGLSSDYTVDTQGKEVVDNTCGTIFLGTPFKGSPKAPWATIAERVLGVFKESSNLTIQDLDKSSVKLQQISESFIKLLGDRFEASKEGKVRPIQVACFYEAKDTKKSKKVMGKTTTVNVGQIVTSESASLPNYKPIAIQANHSLISKFADEQDQGYLDVTGTMKLMISNLDKKKEDLQNNSAHTHITFGDFKQGDNFTNIGGFVTGHIVSTTKDGVNMSTTNTFHGLPIPEKSSKS